MRATTARATDWRRWTSISWPLSVGVKGDEDEIDELDEDEGDDDPAHSVDEHVAAQDGGRSGRSESHAAQGQRYQRHDHEGIEDDGGEHGALWAVQMQDVERLDLRI